MSFSLGWTIEQHNYFMKNADRKSSDWSPIASCQAGNFDKSSKKEETIKEEHSDAKYYDSNNNSNGWSSHTIHWDPKN